MSYFMSDHILADHWVIKSLTHIQQLTPLLFSLYFTSNYITISLRSVFCSLFDLPKRSFEPFSVPLPTRIGKSVINSIGPVIGAHTGPGCVALFFMGKHR